MTEIPAVKKGRIIIYRLFDIASEINLYAIESHIKKEVKRLRLSKHPYMKALEFANPPVSFELSGFSTSFFGQDIRVGVVAKAYDFGVLSLAFEVPIPADTALPEIERVSRAIDSEALFDGNAKDYIRQLINDLGSAMTNPVIKEKFIEDYTVFFIEDFSRGVPPSEILKVYDISRLLLYETRDVSQSMRDETLKCRFSYYPDDLVIVHINNAFIIEPSGNLDILDILEFANAQILELRYYDSLIDIEMAKIYEELPSRGGVSVFSLRTYERLVRKITETVTELTEVTEKVDNALKVTEDVYYAKIYMSAMQIFRSRDWELSIKEKLQIVTNTYRMLYNEITTKRGHLIELGIFLLIVLEIVLFMFIDW